MPIRPGDDAAKGRVCCSIARDLSFPKTALVRGSTETPLAIGRPKSGLQSSES
jgi:hypothetical protein